MSRWYVLYMRTTIRINDDVLRAAKKAAVERDISLTKLIEEALREKLEYRAEPVKNRRVRLTTFSGNGLQPGVDLDDSASLIEIMES